MFTKIYIYIIEYNYIFGRMANNFSNNKVYYELIFSFIVVYYIFLIIQYNKHKFEPRK